MAETGNERDDRLGDIVADRTVSPYVCLAERGTHRAMLALNAAGVIARLPRSAFRASPVVDGQHASREPVTHWIAVLAAGHRIAVRTLQCEGDYRAAAHGAVAFATELTSAAPPRTGIFGPEDLLGLESLAPRLREAGITVVDRAPDDASIPARQGVSA